jgi:hypothetical protein
MRARWVFPAIIAWKFGLIGFFALPPPTGDAFFFDGAVINWLKHDGYYNPSIVRVFPINGSEVFFPYPPFYQAIVLPWMTLFGPSGSAALWLHGVLFASYAVLICVLLRRLEVSVAASNLAGLFLLGMTFHDRPDSVAHVTGVLALLAWFRPVESRGRATEWMAGLLVMLTLATSLHIGAMYGAILWMHALLHRRGQRWDALIGLVCLPIILAAVALRCSPILWSAFSENLLATPSFTGYRIPAFTQVLTVLRSAPGLIIIAVALGCPSVRDMLRDAASRFPHATKCFFPLFAGGVFVVLAALFVVTPNYVNVAAYVQVPAVALFAWLVFPGPAPRTRERWLRPLLTMAAIVVSVRAIGLSTWGVVSVLDVNRSEASLRAQRAIDALPDQSEALVSAAYLYALTDQQRVTCLHADWPGALGGEAGLRPSCLVLTAFDYHRRYRATLDELVASGRVRIVSAVHKVRVRPPDGFSNLQRVVQHLTWAPVIVHLEWR